VHFLLSLSTQTTNNNPHPQIIKTFIMKLTTLSVLALSAAAVNARFVEPFEQNQVVINADAEPELYLIELAPGTTRWVTEEEKWELRRVCNEPSWPNSLTCAEWQKLHGHHSDSRAWWSQGS
jgi:hypothetical protein